MGKKNRVLPMYFVCSGCGQLVKFHKTWESTIERFILYAEPDSTLEVFHSVCKTRSKMTKDEICWEDGSVSKTVW